MSIIEECTRPAMEKMVGQQEELIRRAVVDVIGVAWLPQDIKRRCRFDRIIGETWQTLYIDGEPVLMLFDVEFPEAERLDDRYVCKVTQRYKYVGRASHLNGAER
jgi:hypothetical protein